MALLGYAEQVTRDATQITTEGIRQLRDAGWSDEEIVEATLVACFFNNFDRVADALGVALDELPDA